MASVQLTNCGVGVIATNGGKVTVNGDINVSPQDLGLEAFSLPKLIQTFQGREKEIEKLDRLLFTEKKKKIVICGIPGYGKTELSKQYANHCVENNKIQHAIWVRAENEDNLHKSSEKLNKIYNALKGQTCLFIFDNAISRQEIFDYEPPENDNFMLLITSIETNWDDDVVPFRLEPLPPESAVDVYKSILNDNYQEEDRKLYEQLADIIGNVPLGLQVTGAYVRQQRKILGKGFNLESYIQTLNQCQKQVITLKIPRGTANTYQKSMYGALLISLERIEECELRELVVIILYLCCYLDPEYIKSSDLLNMSNSTEIKPDSHDKDQFLNALDVLNNYCFVNFDAEKEVLTMHSYTQDILRFHAIEADSLLQTKCYEVCLYFVLSTNFVNKGSTLRYADDNVTTVYKFFEKHVAKNDLDLTKLFDSFARYGLNKTLKKIFDESGDHLTKKYIHEINLLHKAVQHNRMETVKLILQYGGDVNNKSFLCHTPLHEAASAWNLNAIQILKEHNADLNARNYNGDIPLFCLFRNVMKNKTKNQPMPWMPEFATSFLEIKDILLTDAVHKKKGRYGNMEIINDILDELKFEEYKNTTNNNGESLLHLAASRCNDKMVNFLITRYKMEVNQPDVEGRSPLYSLVSLSCIPEEKPMDLKLELSQPMLKSKLFSFCMQPEEKKSEMEAWLYSIISTLINQKIGINANKLNVEEAIPTAQMLILNGARMDINDSNGMTLIEFAEQKPNNVFVLALCDNKFIAELKKVFDYLGAERTKNFIIKQDIINKAIYSNHFDILNLLLQYDVNFNEIILSPIHLAAGVWNPQAIRILLQHDADLWNLRHSNGETPLFWFIYGAKNQRNINIETAIEILDLLKVEHHKEIANNEGRTILHISAAAGQEELVELLVNKYKMKTNVKDKSGHTPLQLFNISLDSMDINKESVIKMKTILEDCNDQKILGNSNDQKNLGVCNDEKMLGVSNDEESNDEKILGDCNEEKSNDKKMLEGCNDEKILGDCDDQLNDNASQTSNSHCNICSKCIKHCSIS